MSAILRRRQRIWTPSSRGRVGLNLLPDLVAHWRLDEASGTRVDVHGGNDLTDNNTVTQNTGLMGNAAEFTAANSEYLSIADNATLSGGDRDFTLAVWFYPTLGGAIASRTLCAKGGNLDWEFAMRVVEDTVNYIDPQFLVSPDGTAGFTVIQYSSTTVTVNNWHLLIAWHDSVNNLIGIELDNASPQTNAFSAGVFDGAGAFMLGQVDSGSFFNGRIDSVSRWNRLLTSDEKTALYAGGAGLDYPFS